jgi:hypothetical protein
MATDVSAFFVNNDLSVHIERVESGNNVQLYLVANSLADLTRRENRFCHDPLIYKLNPAMNNSWTYLTKASLDGQYPYPCYVSSTFSHLWISGNTPYEVGLYLDRMVQSGIRLGEDVMASAALAFDVRVFDPFVFVSHHPGDDGAWGKASVDDDSAGGADDIAEAGWPGSDDEVVQPGDPGYGQTGNATINSSTSPTKQILFAGEGAYVDLNFHGKYLITAYPSPLPLIRPYFGTGGDVKSGLDSPLGGLFDTAPSDYERDGINQDSYADSIVDEATDGLDTDSANGIDDIVERETAPPYPFPLRGLQVRIRMIDQDTRQVLQTSVFSDLANE